MILVRPSYKFLGGIDPIAILQKIERIGRTAYKSEEKITNNSCGKFVRKIVASGHHSVLEHHSFSVRFIVDRGVTHELVRHRLCAFTQESTRYCNYKGGVTFVIPPWLRSTEVGPGQIWADQMNCAEEAYLDLLEQGWKPQQARSVLPNSLKTEIVTTANLREWRHILTLRTANDAHPQIREVMCPLLVDLKYHIPSIFEDINSDCLT